MKYRVVKLANGMIIARGLSLSEASEAYTELCRAAPDALYVIRRDDGAAERINVV